MSTGADLYQVQISKDDEAVTSRHDAEMVLSALGVEYDHIETDGIGGEEAGVWLVGLLGRVGDQAACGDQVRLSEGGLLLEVPQP